MSARLRPTCLDSARGFRALSVWRERGDCAHVARDDYTRRRVEPILFRGRQYVMVLSSVVPATFFFFFFVVYPSVNPRHAADSYTSKQYDVPGATATILNPAVRILHRERRAYTATWKTTTDDPAE